MSQQIVWEVPIYLQAAKIVSLATTPEDPTTKISSDNEERWLPGVKKKSISSTLKPVLAFLRRMFFSLVLTLVFCCI